MNMAAGGVPARRIGIDVGGSTVLGVALDSSGCIAGEVRQPTPRGPNSLSPLVDVIITVAEELGNESNFGIGVPGLVTREGVLRAAPNLDGVADFEIGRVLGERLGNRVYVDSDATCAAVGEWKLGVAEECDNVLAVTLGTGIGGGIVADGRLARGASGFAGEFGHMVIDPDGPPCPCGRRGCWERFASGSGLARLAQEAAADGRLPTVLRACGGEVEAVRGEHVQDAARAGDSDALTVIDEFASWVALGLANLTNVIDPEMIVLGGGLSEGADLYLDPIRRWYGERLYQPHLRPVPPIVFAHWGPLAGAVGAALLPGLEPWS